MKFKGSARHGNDSKEKGLVSVSTKIPRYIALDEYCWALISSALEFAADSGMTGDEMNQSLDNLRKLIANIHYSEMP